MKIIHIPRRIFMGFIFLYQKTLSPDHSWLRFMYPYGYCRYFPTCSTYAYQALAKYGVFKGLYLSIKRLLRCTPFHEGGIDKVPE